MAGIVVLLTASVVGVDFGWQPVAGGGIEYIIRLDRQSLAALEDGDDLFSDLPPSLEGVRSYRITAATGPLPHENEPLPDFTTVASELPGPARDEGWEPWADEADWPVESQIATGIQSGRAAKRSVESPEDEGDSSDGQSVRRADFREPADGRDDAAARATEEPTSDESSPSDAQPEINQSEGPSTRWAPLAATVAGLCVSVGGNVYLAWLLTGLRGRYSALLASKP